MELTLWFRFGTIISIDIRLNEAHGPAFENVKQIRLQWEVECGVCPWNQDWTARFPEGQLLHLLAPPSRHTGRICCAHMCK